jgi:pimeloyl-ACP methyl ester carboxylesterase
MSIKSFGSTVVLCIVFSATSIVSSSQEKRAPSEFASALDVTDIEGKTAGGIYFRKSSTPRSRDAFVLVMGYGGSGRIWPRDFVDKLAQKFTVITYDNRGTGYSIVPQDQREYTIKKMSDDLDEVVDKLGIRQLHLLGYSMGSCIALQYARDHAAKVKTLFLLSGTAGGALYVKPSAEMSAALAHPQGDTLWELYMSSFKLMYSRETLKRVEPQLRKIFEASKDTPTTPAGLAGHSNAFGQFDGTAFLAGLKMPTTILAGQDDRLMPVQNSENLAKAILGARLVLVPDCQHGAHVQCENLVREIERFAGSGTASPSARKR